MKKAAALLILLFFAVAIPDLYYRGHQYFVTGLNPYLGWIFLVIAIVIAIPLVIFFARWLAKLGGGASFFSPALLFGIAAISIWILRMLEQFYLSNSTLDIYMQDAYFVVKGFPSKIMPITFALFSIIYLSIEKLSGKQLNRILSYTHFGLTFIVMHLMFIPPYYVIRTGMPRRYFSYEGWVSFAQFRRYENTTNPLVLVLIIAQLLFFLNLIITFTKQRQHSV